MMGLYKSILGRLGESRGVAAHIEESFSIEMVLAASELEALYDEAEEGDELDPERVSETEDYLYEGALVLPGTLRAALARRAIAHRSGLPPRRGVVPIEAEEFNA